MASWHGVLALLLVPALLAGPLAAAGDLAGATGGRAHDSIARDPSPAERARASGKRVEVPEETGPARKVYANPDGTFTAELTAEPVRGRKNGAWAPLDLDLRVTEDGDVAPEVAATPLRLSGGGDGPLVRFGDSAARVELTWPGKLPEPVLDGDTATYREVLPEVDLTVRATPRGFTHVLVVRTAEAARDPRLAEIRFGMKTAGVKVRETGTGALVATGKDGGVAFQAAPATMWDASGGGTARAMAESGGRRAPVEVKAGADHLTLTPDQELLTDPKAQFPLFIDPDWGSGPAGWGNVYRGMGNTRAWGGDGDGFAKIGRCIDSRCGDIDAARAYFQFDVSPLFGAVIRSAEFNIPEVHSYSCEPRWVHAQEAGRVDSGLTWNNQPWRGIVLGSHNVAYGYSAACPARNLGFDAVIAVRNAVWASSPTTTVALVAGDENDGWAWKRFASSATLVVGYNRVPGAPAGLSAENRACAVEPNEPYVFTPTPTLRATAADPDGLAVSVQFEWYVRFGGKKGDTTTLQKPSGSQFSITLPTGAFTNGSKIAYRARISDGLDWGPFSQWCDVTVDQDAPDRAPHVGSATYPEDDIGGAAGRTAAFTLSANGVPDVTRFMYRLDNAPPAFANADRPGGSASVLLTPPDAGPHDLYVQSIDRAGNVGAVEFRKQYHFAVGRGTPPVGHWRMDGRTSDVRVPDVSGGGRDGTVTNTGSAPKGAAWGVGRHGDALRMDGSTGHVSASGGSAVRTDQSFSVSAWVRLENADGRYRTAVSQDAKTGSGFYLQYTMSGNWAFSMLRRDELQPPADRAVASGPAAAGVWTHLTGVFDLASKEMRLYVNGARAATATHATPWHADGAVQIGRAKHDGQPVDFWPGGVDEVRLYDRVLGEAEIHDLATAPATDEGLWPLEGSGADLSGNHRSMTATGGVTWADGKLGSAVRLDGTGYLSTAAAVLRTEASYTVSAWVRLDRTGDGTRAILTQDGVRGSGFGLKYRIESGKWSISVPNADADGTGFSRAESAGPAVAGEWTHLTAVRDAAAGRLRLYVNGEIDGDVPFTGGWPSSGGLQIGRSKIAGAPAERWIGLIDNVRVHNGVRTDDQIREEYYNPVVRRDSAYPGQLSRYADHDFERLTSTGPVPPGYYLEISLGTLAPEGAPGTHKLYACAGTGIDTFTSTDPECEHGTPLAELGSVYADPPDGVTTMAVYRCRSPITGQYFDSPADNCENNTVDRLLGYTLPYAHLNQYAQQDRPRGRIAEARSPGATYRVGTSLGLVTLRDSPGARGLLRCRAGEDEYLDLGSTCEGATTVFWIGNVWSEPPPNALSTLIHACRDTETGERFESDDAGCEGQTTVRTLGYVITRWGA
ncbi:LamG-like jellyroll fold domain-containing protein [Nonomuraea sp. NPDC048882]|uniref:LamG-like jellyroll fold domain-containing protein n=1 Tax=Nonomuraea sp. NPDC048882 TaxID=3154347 RepID=UPI0033E8768B